MVFRNSFIILFVIFALVISSFAQSKPSGDGTYTQRFDIMRSKLDTIRNSLKNVIASMKGDSKDEKKDKKDKDKKDAKVIEDTPLSRLKGLEKEASGLQSDINSLRGKVDRSEKFDSSDIDQLEISVSDLNGRVETELLASAKGRAVVATTEGDAREIKKKKKFLWIFGRAGNDEIDELIGTVRPGRDKELFLTATREVRKGNHEVGRLLFNVIITTYAESLYLPMAKLAIADSFYLEGDTSNLIQAVASYQDWLAFFPTHPLAPRVLLKIAESEMRQVGRPDRDATKAKRAEQKLKVMIQQYPDSELIVDAKKRLIEVQDNLGLYNLWIGNFYYKRAIDQKKPSGLKGAQSRYRDILAKYPDFGYLDEALFKIAVTYQVEEETDEAAKYFQRVVRDYPNSEYVEKSKEQLTLMGATIPEPNPARMNVTQPEKDGFFSNFKNEFFGAYPMTIDLNGVLMTKKFEKEKFELIDQIIKNEGELNASDIPKALTTIIGDRPSNTPK
jgi:outer membrane assembly lipoprotein YfiO